ncbi:PX domain-containing protein, partial [Fusarium coicis]
MSSTAFPNQNAPQPGASLTNPPKPKAIALNGSPLPPLSHTQDDGKPLLTDKPSDANDLANKTTTTNDAMNSGNPITNSTRTETINTRTAAEDGTPITKVIHFFATATPESLAGVAVGFAAFTYFTMGRLGLVLIGALGGVAGFISWEARNPELAKAVRGERGIDVIDRLLVARSNQTGEKREDNSDDEEPTLKNFDEFRPETREALGGLVDAIVRDYVKWWYSPIVPTDHSFPLACRKTLTSYLLSVSSHLNRKRPADAFLDLLTNSSSIIIVFMSELASAFSELPPDSSMTAADAVYNYLASNPDCHLANLLNQRQQASKFKMVAEDLLGFLDRNAYNCDPARVFL